MRPNHHGPADAHLACPACTDYDVQRLYLGSLHVDSCECRSCGARWDEDRRRGAFGIRAPGHGS